MKKYFTKWDNHLYTTPYKGNKKNVLVIGDLHAPFTLKTYLQFCRHQQEKFDCGTVIFIGDIVDNHYSSFHDTDPSGMGADDEVNEAILQLNEWKKLFPSCYVTIGNHDAIIARKLFANGISQKYLKSFNEVFNLPKEWKFVDQIIINKVLYTHGTTNALKRMTDARISVVQGHLHSLSYVQHSQSEIDGLFAVQTGCGIDIKSFAFAYGKSFGKKPVISCAVILDNGKLPIVITI